MVFEIGDYAKVTEGYFRDKAVIVKNITETEQKEKFIRISPLPEKSDDRTIIEVPENYLKKITKDEAVLEVL